ncbi:MAG: 3-methyl-2-oxobutanoate hydroxymethyltransferase, partial [Acidobacteriota bacterium]|nr:3-methyl-2-oxobutanoate hydroxymethyltransferase [Acidobacteriota bacterium]
MSATPPLQTDKVTVPNLLNRKRKGGKIVCLTAYDYPFARILDQAGIDLVLVGDSLATTRMGHDSTLPLRVKDVLRHLKAVRRGLQRALLVADLPYGSYHLSAKEALRAALKFIKAGAEAVKIEGGSRRSRLVKRLVRAEIPVMGHVGLTPQSLHVMGGY